MNWFLNSIKRHEVAFFSDLFPTAVLIQTELSLPRAHEQICIAGYYRQALVNCLQQKNNIQVASPAYSDAPQLEYIMAVEMTTNVRRCIVF